MENEQKKPKRTLRDVSHHFFSSLDNEKNNENDIKKISDAVADEIEYKTDNKQMTDLNIENDLHASKDVLSVDNYKETPQGFTPSLKVLSILPIAQPAYSLYYSITFAQVFQYAGSKIYILSSNPQSDVWNVLSSMYRLPAFFDIDFDKKIHTFSLTNSIELLIIKPECLEEFFAFHNVDNEPAKLFDSGGQEIVFLMDCLNTNSLIKKRIMAMLDAFIIITPPEISNMRDMYKTIKMCIYSNPQVVLKCILHQLEDKYLEEFLQREFNTIASNYLKKNIEFIGFYEGDTLVSSPYYWETKSSKNDYRIDISFFEFLRKSSWSEDILSIFQTVIGTVKY